MAHQDPRSSWSLSTTPRWTKKAVPAPSCPPCITTVLETHHDRSTPWILPTNATQQNQHLKEGVPSLRLRNSDLNGSVAPSTTHKSKLSQSLIGDMSGIPTVIEMRTSLMPKRRLVSSHSFAIPTERYAEFIFKWRTLKILGSRIQRPRPSRKQNHRPNHRTFLLSHPVHMVGQTVVSPLLRHVSHTRQNSHAIFSPYISQACAALPPSGKCHHNFSHRDRSVTILDATAQCIPSLSLVFPSRMIP